jgi:hypothetical protein
MTTTNQFTQDRIDALIAVERAALESRRRAEQTSRDDVSWKGTILRALDVDASEEDK